MFHGFNIILVINLYTANGDLITQMAFRAHIRYKLRTFMKTTVLRSVLLLVLTVVLLWLLVSPAKFVTTECPAIFGDSKLRRRPQSLSSDRILLTDEIIDCASIISGNVEEITKARRYVGCSPRQAISDEQYVLLTEHCDQFLTQRGYTTGTSGPIGNTQEEIDFPIAYSILMFEHVEQTERLLRAIYRPQNFYCIHVDAKSAHSVHKAMSAIAGCFNNVFIASELIDVTWAWFPVLKAEIICMRDLLRRSRKWKYFINLTGREFPLRTNLELVHILSAYNGSNDVDGTLWRRPLIWTRYHWRSENWMSWQTKRPPPHAYIVAKGSTHIAVTRAFVEFVIHDKSAQDLLDWMQDVRSPDEHYFPTLNHNPHMGVPGAYTENPDFKTFLTRFKVWQNKVEHCAGRWFRFLCNFGVGDLQRLAHAPQLFANKWRYELEPLAFSCMEQWYRNRSLEGIAPKFNRSFYAGQLWVKHHT